MVWLWWVVVFGILCAGIWAVQVWNRKMREAAGSTHEAPVPEPVPPTEAELKNLGLERVLVPEQAPKDAQSGRVLDVSGDAEFVMSRHDALIPCPYCLGLASPPELQGQEALRYMAARENTRKYIAAEDFQKAWQTLDSIVLMAPLRDHYLLLTHIYDAFEGLCEECSPFEVLTLFDRLLYDGNAMSFAKRHRTFTELSMVLGYSLSRYPVAGTPADVKGALAFVARDHPLMRALHKADAAAVVAFLDMQMSDIFAGWEEREGDTDIAGVVSRITARLKALEGGRLRGTA